MESLLNNVDKRILEGLVRMGIQSPLPIQTSAVPIALQGKDLLISGRTGCGKTLAYSIPLVQRVMESFDPHKPQILAVVLVPTYELGEQVTVVINTLCQAADKIRASHKSVNVVDTGARISPIIVCTPIGLNGYLRSVQGGKTLLSSLKCLVVDEVDLLMSLGYAKDMKTLSHSIDTSPARMHQTILCSATLGDTVSQIKRLLLHKPAIVELEDTQRGTLSQFYEDVVPTDRTLILYCLFNMRILPPKVLIFCNTIASAYTLSVVLLRLGVKCQVLASSLPRNTRLRIIDGFNQGVVKTLVASDDCTTPKATDKESAPHRGIDFENVGCVFNYDMPDSANSYIHRVGRTARGGEDGLAISFVRDDKPSETELIQQLTDKFQQFGETLQPLGFPEGAAEAFRYRVEAVRRNVTTKQVAVARLEQLHKELLKSEKMKSHFSRNPSDSKILKKAVRTLEGRLKKAPNAKALPRHMADLLPTQIAARGIRNWKSQKGGKGKGGKS